MDLLLLDFLLDYEVVLLFKENINNQSYLSIYFN